MKIKHYNTKYLHKFVKTKFLIVSSKNNTMTTYNNMNR